jgi:hypothetical protein
MSEQSDLFLLKTLDVHTRSAVWDSSEVHGGERDEWRCKSVQRGAKRAVECSSHFQVECVG